VTKVKICGLSTVEAVQTVNQIQADLAGFVFAPSKRQVNFDQAQQLRQVLEPSIAAVGVFVTPDLALISRLAQTATIQIVQLHGPQDQAVTDRIHQLGLRVTQVLHPGDTLTTTPDYVMFDGVHPGSGQRIAWQDITQMHQPTFLAGGLTPANVETAIERVHPDFVDVSSGVETNGIKDPTKIIEFTRRAHHAGNENNNY